MEIIKNIHEQKKLLIDINKIRSAQLNGKTSKLNNSEQNQCEMKYKSQKVQNQ